MRRFDSSEPAYQLLSIDPEANKLYDSKTSKDSRRFRIIWQGLWPVGKKHLKPFPVLIWATVILAILCISQGIWICNVYAGLRRIPNDPFDRQFPQTITRTSPSIWDTTRQNFIHNARPIRIHSHNDENQRLPLFEALGSGCISIEADTHLIDGNLLVGHSSSNLRSSDNLIDMYINPLLRMIDNQNEGNASRTLRGIFNHDPDQSLVLLIDHKTDGAATLDALYDQLQPLRDRDYLTYWNGSDRIMRPLTIVASGNAPFESILALDTSHRDIFWDADLRMLSSADDDFAVKPPLYKYNISNSYYASAPWADVTLWLLPESRKSSSPQARDLEAPQTEQARSRGLLPRYWDAPARPPNMRDTVWRILRALDVYVINMDDMGLVRDRTSGWRDWK